MVMLDEDDDLEISRRRHPSPDGRLFYLNGDYWSIPAPHPDAPGIAELIGQLIGGPTHEERREALTVFVARQLLHNYELSNEEALGLALSIEDAPDLAGALAIEMVSPWLRSLVAAPDGEH